MRDKEIYRLIGRRLRLRRRLLDMTQGQVALRCGLTFQQIQKYEAGITAMPLARLVALAEVLKTPLEALVQGLNCGDVSAIEDLRESRPVLVGPREMVA